MPDSKSPRHGLPYLSVAQALKEVTHNEALARIDGLLHPLVEGRLAIPPTLSSTDAGKCWIVNLAASGDWLGRDHDIAYWTGGSWRFHPPIAGMKVRNWLTGVDMVWTGTSWISGPVINNPQSGAVVDAEARAAVIEILSYLRMTGQIEN